MKLRRMSQSTITSKDVKSVAKVAFTKRKVREYGDLITCPICKGYIIDATAVKHCLHTFCRTCIVKHLELAEKVFKFCPTCEPGLKPITLDNLRPDPQLRSIIFKLVPGLYQSECQRNSKFNQVENIDNANEKLLAYYQNNKDSSNNESDKRLLEQYFYAQDEPISMSLEYHMESIFGLSTSDSSNVPQVRYLQCPAGVKVSHLKRFVSSKYDLNCSNNSMNIDIIYEDEILPLELSLMDIAYCYKWERVAPMKFFYRIYKSSKSKKKAPKIMLEVKPAPVYKKVIFPAKALKKEAIKNEPKYENKIFLTRSSPSKDSKRSPSPPRHDLKMIIAKKPSPSYTIEDKTKLNKPSTSVKDFKRLRSNEIKCSEYSSTTSFLPKTIESSSARKNVTGTVPLDDSKHFKSYDYGRSKKLDKDDETLLNRHKEEKNTIRLMRQRRFSTGERYTKPKKVPEYDVPKLKIELPSLKTKITVPKQPNENYAISPASASLKSPTCTKKVRFMFPIENLKLKFDRKDPKESEKEGEGNSQVEYAKKIGLKPVERAAENIVHKKRKKSKHSKEESSFKKRKLQAEFSSSLDESLKLKVKFTGVKPEKHERKSNHISEERSVKVEEKEKKKIVNENKKNLVSDEIRVQNHINPFTNLQPMVCIPNLNLKEMDTAKTSEAPTITLVVPLFASNPITSFTSTTVTPVSNSINDSIQKKVEKCVASQGCQTKSPSFTARSLTAKMGSPSGSPKLPIPQRTYMSSTAQSPNVRPQSMPLSLGLSPISSLQSEQNLKRSLSADYTTVVTKQPRSDYADVFERFNNKTHFPQTILRQYSNPHQMKMPMLVSTSNGKPVDKVMPNASAVSSFSNIAKANEYYKKYPDIQKRPLPMLIAPSSVSVTKTSEISVPSPSMDDRPSVEILRISPNVVLHDKQMFGPPQEQKRQEIKPKPAAIPLAKIKKSGINMQNYMNSNQLIFGTGIVQKTPNDLPKLVSYQLPKCQKPEFKRPQQGMTFGFATNLYPPSMSPKSNNATKPNESPEQFTHNQDLVNLNQQLSIDIAKLSQSLNQDVTATSSVEKISSYANILTGIATSYTENMRLRMSQMHPPNNPVSNPSNNVSRQQNMSVRNVPNPSALMFRQQPQKTVNSPISSPTSSIFANAKMLPNDKKTTFNDIEDFLSKTTIGTTNPVTTISTTPQIKDKQLQTVKKNLHLEKLAANLLAAAENKTSSEHLVGQERASDNKVTITIGKLPEKNNNDDSNNNNTNGDIKASDKISTKETTDEGKAGAKIHANSSQTERNDA